MQAQTTESACLNTYLPDALPYSFYSALFQGQARELTTPEYRIVPLLTGFFPLSRSPGVEA